MLKQPYDSVLSFGDLILLVGLCDVAYNASRKPKRRGSRSARPSEPSITLEAAADQDLDEDPVGARPARSRP